MTKTGNFWRHGADKCNLRKPFRWFPKPMLMIVVVVGCGLVMPVLGLIKGIGEAAEEIAYAWKWY